MPCFERALAAAVALACISCRVDSAVDFPHRAPPAGYPASRHEDLPADVPLIPEIDFARALEGRRYRVRYGTLRWCEDCQVDATSSSFPVPAEGPLEQDLRITRGDVSVRIADAPDDCSVKIHRRIACVDVRLSQVPRVAGRRTIVLDMQPLDDDPSLPLAVDAVTGDRLRIDAEKLVDENDGPCDLRHRARVFWDDNLRRLHAPKARPR
jgi:hypothetical protein